MLVIDASPRIGVFGGVTTRLMGPTNLVTLRDEWRGIVAAIHFAKSQFNSPTVRVGGPEILVAKVGKTRGFVQCPTERQDLRP